MAVRKKGEATAMGAFSEGEGRGNSAASKMDSMNNPDDGMLFKGRSIGPRLHKPCLHCKERVVVRQSRGLCNVCYDNLSIRRNYPLLNGMGAKSRGHGLQGVDTPTLGRKTPPWPTTALPGTPEKIVVLEWRASKGYSLWHPQDAKWDQARK
jgi:hypothetical protein